MRVGNDEAGGGLHQGLELGGGEVADADVADGAGGEKEGHCAPGLWGKCVSCRRVMLLERQAYVDEVFVNVFAVLSHRPLWDISKR